MKKIVRRIAMAIGIFLGGVAISGLLLQAGVIVISTFQAQAIIAVWFFGIMIGSMFCSMGFVGAIASCLFAFMALMGHFDKDEMTEDERRLELLIKQDDGTRHSVDDVIYELMATSRGGAREE